MMQRLQYFADACGGRLEGADRPYTAISTDTRRIGAGELYLALRGPRFDGNQFVAAAAAAGAVGAVVDRPVSHPSLPLVRVEDGHAALVRAAGHWRSQFHGAVVGVAGSNGKTTTKEMIAAILARGGDCLATHGNLNNQIGVPLTLLRLAPAHRSAVIEIGANRPGEVAGLAALVRPHVGLITNAGAEHLEGFGDLAGVARAEGEMVAGLAADAVAVLNADDPWFRLWCDMTPARVVSFGVDEPAHFHASHIVESLGEDGFHVAFRLHCPAGERQLSLNLGGRHNVRNALCAAAAATAAGATLDEVVAGLAAMQPVAGRLRPLRAHGGARLLDDSYNANPSSMKAGIDVVASVPGRPWLVMGDMGELGSHAEASHLEIGRHARERGVERLFAIGKLSMLAVESFGSGGSWYPDAESLARALLPLLAPEVTLLVKGSRSNRLEKVVAQLVATDGVPPRQEAR